MSWLFELLDGQGLWGMLAFGALACWWVLRSDEVSPDED